jgi:Ca-activated chloride channel family protein
MAILFALWGLTWQWPWLLILAPVYVLFISIAGFLQRRRAYRISRLGYYVPRGPAWPGSSGGWFYSGLRWSCGLTLVTVGLAGPIWGTDRSAEIAPERDLVVLVDLSRSMLATDVLPSRCARVCASIERLCDHLEARGGVRLALVGFASKGQILCPLTRDYAHVRQRAAGLDPATPPSGTRPDQPGSSSGTRIGAGMQAAVAAVDPEARNFSDIVLLSDGDDPAGDREYRAGIAAAQASKLPVHTVGVGNPQGTWDLELPVRRAGKPAVEHVATALKETPLREIAQATGGVYVPARTQPCDLSGLYDEVIEPLPRADAGLGSVTQPPIHRAWFFAAGLLCLIAELVKIKNLAGRLWASKLRGGRLRLRPEPLVLGFLALVSLAPAFPEAADDYLRAAYRAFAAGNYAEAQAAFGQAKRLTGDPGLAALAEAIAGMRGGQYEDAGACVRQCLEDADPQRRAVALLVRGISTFHRAAEDANLLRQAAADFREVLYSPASTAELASAARHNLELTRLILAEVAPPNGQNQKPGSENEKPGGEKEGTEGAERPGARNGHATDASKQGKGADQGDDQENLLSNPGRGNLPLTIGESGSPLSPSDAMELLANAEKRIQAELLEQRRQRVLDINAPSKDW